MAADVEGVQRLLEELHRLSREGFPDSEINDPAALVEQLSIAVLALDPRSPGQEADVALFASFMFESQAPRDLLSFVGDTINTPPKVTKKARMAALKAVGDFLKRLKGTPIVDRYASRVKDGVWHVFTKETASQEVRSHALRPLRQLLKLKPPTLGADRWKVSSMWDTVKEQYRLGSSKVSQGVKGELLKLAGSLLLVYGADEPELAGGAKTMLGWCDSALDDNAKNKRLQKSLQPQIVAGALACVDLVCSAGFEDRYAYASGAEGQRRNTQLYTHLVSAVRDGTAEGLTRYEVSAKALRFFRRHAGLFSENVGPSKRALQLYDYMEKCASSGGKTSRLKLKKHALPAIEAILREVSRYTAASSEPALRRKTLREFESMFLALLESRNPTSEETTIALAGLAAFSHAATAISSYGEATDVADRLLVCLDSALARLDGVGFMNDESSDEDMEASVTGGGFNAPQTLLRSDRSLKIEAQFLRVLACRAGVLGGVFARLEVATTSPLGAGSEEMDVDAREGESVLGEGIRCSVPGEVGSGRLGGAVPGAVMRRLQALASRLVEKFALLSPKDRSLVYSGLCQLWLALSGPGQGDSLSRMLAVVVQKGVHLAGTMEHSEGGHGEGSSGADALWAAPVDPDTGEADTRFCFIYAELWRRVLNPTMADLEFLQAWTAVGGRGAHGEEELGVAVLYRERVAPDVYDAVLGAVLTAVKRLDLRYTYDTPEGGGRPIPRHWTDQNMFLNLVTFCQDLLPTCRPDLLLEWVPLLCPELVKRSLERPLVSGFYRLVTLVFRETARAGYFDPPPLSSASASAGVSDTKKEVAMSPPTPGSVADAIGLGEGGELGDGGRGEGGGGGNDGGKGLPSGRGVSAGDYGETGEGDGGRLICRRVLCRYLEWITVRIGGFRDELLAACTEALLNAPVGLLGGDLGPLVPVVKVALTSGASHLPTAVVVVSALERWWEEAPALLMPHLGEILPDLDRHLSAEASAGGDGVSSGKARRSRGGKADSSPGSGGLGGSTDPGEEARRKDLRRRIVRFLGRLGGMNHLVATDASHALSDSLAWDTKPRIVLDVPYKEQQEPLQICLDGTLQRLVELARHEGTRQTKTLAAECLHALVVYMVGCTATDPSSGQLGRPGEFSKLFRRIFPAVLRLAVDLDETTRTLFSKLSMQLVRWFSQAQTDNDDTLALLDCLGEGAAAEEGGPLREVCAKGVVEFLRYAIKQTSKRQQAAGPVAVDALLTRVFSLAMHPDRNRRLGGLMAFNQLCRPLREETALLDRYALRLLHVALISLRRAHHDHSALGVADAASSAVDRALRVVHDSVAKMGDRGDLLGHKDHRGQLGSVEEVAGWAWERVGALETRFRRKCMTVLLALCPLIVGDPGYLPADNEGARVWVWRRMRKSGRGRVTEAVRVFESTHQGQSEAGDLSGGGDGDSMLEYEDRGRERDQRGEWDRVATSADCYNFARETGIITADELFLGVEGGEDVAPGGEGDGDHEMAEDGGQGKGRASGKKRKASSPRSGGVAEAEGATSAAPPRMLGSIAGIIARFGKYLEEFPFQSLVGEVGSQGQTPGNAGGNEKSEGGIATGEATNRSPPGSRVPVPSRPLVMDDPGALPTDRAAAQLSRAVLLRRSFTLLAGCVSDSARPAEMTALLVKEGLWSRDMHLVVIYSLVWPWAGGLLPRASDGDEVEQSRTTLRASGRLPPKTLDIVTRAVLPAAVGRLLKHWEILDKAAGEGRGFLRTLQTFLRVQVSDEDNTAAPIGAEDAFFHRGGGSSTSTSSTPSRDVDLCRWIMSQSLTSQEAFSRPSLAGRASGVGDHAWSRIREPGSTTSSSGAFSRQRQPPPDEELTSRVIRAYRAFAAAGLFGSRGSGDALHLAAGLWSTVLCLPEGLRPASEHRASLALRLAIDLGLPTISGTASSTRNARTSSGGGGSGGRDAGTSLVHMGEDAGVQHAASVLAGLLNVHPVERAEVGGAHGGDTKSSATGGRRVAGGATRGALFYRRFSEPIHEALLKRGAACPWPRVCRSLVEACMSSGSDEGAVERHPLLATQAFSVLEGVLAVQSEQQAGAARLHMIGPTETLSAIVPEFRRLVNHPDWESPPAEEAKAGKGRMVRESLRLCHRLLRLAAAVESSGKCASGTNGPEGSGELGQQAVLQSSSYFHQLLEISGVLVAGTLESASPTVDAFTKADALTLVPFLRPCLMRKAKEYGHSAPAAGKCNTGGDGGGGVGEGMGSGENSARVLRALEEMMSRHFPIENSREPVEGSKEAAAFALLLRGLLGAFVRCGDLGLLELLFGTLAEGRRHLHYRWVSWALDAFVSRVDVEADGVAEAVFGFCLCKISDHKVPVSVKAVLFDKVCLPMVRRCPIEVSRALYLSTTAAGSAFDPGAKGENTGMPVLRRLSAVFERRSKQTGKFLAGPLIASCCFALVEALYEMLSRSELKSLADEAFGKNDALKEVTKTVAKAWKAVKDGYAPNTIPDQSWLELRSRRAVFSCVCTVVRVTQDQEKHFDSLLWADSFHDLTSTSADKTSVLALLLDLSKEHTFEVSPPPFHTTGLRSPRPPPLGGHRRVGRTGRVTASDMLSQSSLGFGGDSLVGMGGGTLGGLGSKGDSDGLSGETPAEDVRESYSSQLALTEPGGASGDENNNSQGSSSQSQESPAFGRRGSSAVAAGGGGRAGVTWEQGEGGEATGGTEEEQEDDVMLEMSHVNKEPVMRSLLLVVQAERRVFEEGWLDAYERSHGVFEPAWSAKMRAKLADRSLPRNVRLLAFQFAINAPVAAAVVPWAVPWIVAMADFALAPLPEGLRTDGEKGLHYLLRDFAQVLLDETSNGWGSAVREARAQERLRAVEAGDPGDISQQPLLDVGNRLVSHLMSVSSCPEGKTTMLRANVMLVAGLVGLFGEAVEDEQREDGEGYDGDDGAVQGVRAPSPAKRNDLRLNLQYVVDMLLEREGHTGGAHARNESAGAQAKHTILTALNLLGVLLGKNVPIFASSVRAADELARTLPDVCLSYVQKNTFETGTELLAMALAHVDWLKDGGLPPEDELCAQCRAENGDWFVRRVNDRLVRMSREGARSRFLHAVATLTSFYPAVLTRNLLLSAIEAMQFAEATCRGRFLATLADAFPRGLVPTLEVQSLFTRLQPFLPSLLLEPEVEFVRGSRESGQASEWIPTAQLSALRLLRALAPTMTSKQLGSVLGEDDAHSLVGLATPSTFRGCREVAYATLLDLHVATRKATDTIPDENARGGVALTHAQRETVRCALLRGLSDPDDEGMTFDDARKGEGGEEEGIVTRRGIRRSLLDVFDSPVAAAGRGGGLNEAPGQRLLSLMRDMFDSRTARAWLRFAPYLLLRPAEQAPGYNSPLFKSSLLSCEFVDMPVVGGARGLDARPMEPVFSYASLNSQSQSQDDSTTNASSATQGYSGGYGTLSTDVAVRKAGMVRATQDYLWSQTQGPEGGDIGGVGGGGMASRAGRGGDGRGTASAAVTARPRYVAFASQTQSRMLAGPKALAGSQAAMPPPMPRPPGARGNDPRGGVASQGGGRGGVGKRFWHTSGGSVSSLGKGETFAMQRRMAAKRQRDKATRTKRAVIYRKYRDGELPDIQIKLGDVLRPLQHLSMLDGGIAREVFVQIFKGVYEGLGDSAGAPLTSQSNSSTQQAVDDDNRREASMGEGRRAVAILLHQMLSAAKHDTDVVACLHAACRATSSASFNVPSSAGASAGRGVTTEKRGGNSQPRRSQGRGRLLGSPHGPGSSELGRSSGGAKKRGVAAESMEEGTLDVATERGDIILISPDLVANTALSSLNIHSGILLLEDAIMRTGMDRAASSSAPTGGGGDGAKSAGRGKRGSRAGAAAAAVGGLHGGPGGAVVDVEKGQQDSWLQLSKLYAALGERDALVGVAARASRLDGTRQALEAELAGEYDVALGMYKKLLKRYDNRYEKDGESQESLQDTEENEGGVGGGGGSPGASEAELRAWDLHQLECMRNLGLWKQLRGEVLAMVSEDEDYDEEEANRGSVEDRAADSQRRLWTSEPSQRDDVLPLFVWSIVHDQDRKKADLNAFLDAIVDSDAPLLRLADSSPGGASSTLSLSASSSASTSSSSSTCTRLAWLETNMPGELAKAFLLGGQLGRAHQCVARCYDRFQEKWAALHPCADSARRHQLRGLQLVVEVEDFLSFHDEKVTIRDLSPARTATLTTSTSTLAAEVGLPGRLTALLRRWSLQAPSATLDPVTSWSAVVAHRSDCFEAIEGDLDEKHPLEVEAAGCRRAMLKHSADLSLVAAGAAIAQGAQKVAEKLIVSYTKIKRRAGYLSGGGKEKAATGGRGGDGDVDHVADPGTESDWDLDLALTTVEYNKAKLERIRLMGTRTGTDVAERRASTVARTLKVLKGCILQQQSVMRARASGASQGAEGRDGGGGIRGWGTGDGWASDDAGANETRLRLLTLQGQWLEVEGRMLSEPSSAGKGGKGQGEELGRSSSAAVASSLKGALASLEEATELGDALVASSSPSPSPEGGSVGLASRRGGARTSGVLGATGDAMLLLAKLCEGLSTGDGGLEAGVGGGGKGREELASLSVKQYLRAMAIGSAGARDRFPRVLFLVGEFPKARQAFSEWSSSVPEWAFLRWVSQMLGVTGRQEGPVVIQVLERVARAFPRALFYPLLITKTSGARGRAVIDSHDTTGRLSKLSALAFDASAEAFAEALRGLHHPELRFVDDMKRVLELLAKKETALARETYRKLRSDCLVIDGRKTGDKRGLYNRNFAKQRVAGLDRELGKNGELLDLAKAKKWLMQAHKWATAAKKQTAGKAPLSDFSSWMSDFDPNVHKLEVPGQYDGMSSAPPRVSHHSRVVSFGSELLVMKSLRLPKRLTMHGDDEKDHMFLIKGGEDLRVDQRVEQLFEVMNAIMATSASCRRARLANKTYKVVPVTTDIGLIEWVQNTKPLKAVIEEGLGMPLSQLQAPRLFAQFLGGDLSPTGFHGMFKSARREKVEEQFAACCASVPTNALRRHLLAMAPSPEAFLTCRGGFARSLAALNACSYVLGIGDRHLENFLLDTTTGTVVGIDFGAAFGFGSSELPVPELIPFRLTNQFRNLLQPLDSVGLLKGHMVSTLQALRGGWEVLLATMDVFLNEPVMEWVSEGGGNTRQKKSARETTAGEGEEDLLGSGANSSQAHPPSDAGRKIRNARRKLQGGNPAAVVIDDLEQNMVVKKNGSLEQLKAISWGRSGNRVRSRPEHREGWLSVEDQVECLIDLATDPDVLGRQWIGLATWV